MSGRSGVVRDRGPHGEGCAGSCSLRPGSRACGARPGSSRTPIWGSLCPDEIRRLRIEGRSAGASTTVGPLATHELSVPAKDGLRPDHERSPSLPGERPARRGEERPIPVAKLRPADRTSEHLHLVAQDGVLELELRHTPTSGEPSDETNEDEVDEGSQGAGMLPTSVN